jgi:hypothetical protein
MARSLTSAAPNTEASVKEAKSKAQPRDVLALEAFLARTNNAGLHTKEPDRTNKAGLHVDTNTKNKPAEDDWELIDTKEVNAAQDKEEWTLIGKTAAEKKELEKRIAEQDARMSERKRGRNR